MTKEIRLSDEDWRWATWRNIPPLAVPAEAPFDRDDVLARIAKVRATKWNWDFSTAALSPSMSKDEARLFLECFLDKDRGKPKDKAAALAKVKKLPALTLPATMKRFAVDPAQEFPLVLARLFSPLEVTEILLAKKPGSDGYDGGGRFFNGYRKWVFPYLTTAERKTLAKRIAPKITPKAFPTDPYKEPSGEFLLGALLGVPELEAVVASWKDDRYVGKDWFDAYHVPQVIILGLKSAALVDEHMRRLKLALRAPHFLAGWIAHNEYAGLDYAVKAIVETKNKDMAAELASVLALVRAPENAGPMLEVATKSKAPKVGATWLEENPEHAANGLASIATGRGALAEAAATQLADLKRAGHAVSTTKATKGAAVEDAPALATLKDTPSWLKAGLAKAKSLTPPKWVPLAKLPELEVTGKQRRALAGEHVAALVGALAASTLEEPHPLVSVVKANSTESSRDAFAWRLYSEWVTAGAVSKEKWALGALGHLGGDASALKLAPLVRAWPGESQHQRAVFGLDVLGAIGTDVALVQLSGIAQKVKFQALKRRANEAMERIAKTRKMTRDELEDRIVPDGGFGADGKRFFSFGPRRFELVLGEGGAPMVKDEGGTKRSDLPKPGKQDDAAAAKTALEEWKTLKKGLRETTKIQIERLEQAMVKGRAWPKKDFEELLVRHPLLSHLVRQVVWAAVSGGKQIATFRVTEDGTYANAQDDAYKLRDNVTVRIVHPLDLDDKAMRAWSTVFGDYQILAPFPQLGRPVHALDAKEKKLDDLAARFKGQTWGVSAFVGKMKRRGWIHGTPQDAGFVGDQHKPFFSANVTAVIEHTGYPIGSLEYADPQKIEHVFFLSGTGEIDSFSNRKRLKLDKVDPKAVSEVLYDLGI